MDAKVVATWCHFLVEFGQKNGPPRVVIGAGLYHPREVPQMAPTYRTSAAEYAAIHHATCRYRRQQLVCSTCTDLAERAARLAVRVQVAA
jgi:hypothetical protein